jgi:pimeloyl-ACP methyl ester carboxylesterase
VTRSSPRLREPVASQLPVLLMSGRLDPVSPARWTRIALRTLGAARILEMPDEGHGVIRRSCGAKLAAQFLAQPQAKLTPADCMAPPQ